MNTSHKQSSNARRENNSKLSAFKKLTVVTVVGAIAALSVMSAASASRVAYITDGDATYTVTTADTDTNSIIEKAGLTLSEFDNTVVTEVSGDRIDIEIVRAFSVQIKADNSTKEVQLTGGTVADALKQAGIGTSANDFISPAANTALEENMQIEVKRGVKIYLTCDGATNIVYVPEGKVGEALKFVGYQLSEDDDVSVDVKSEVKSGMTVQVDRVEYRTTYDKETIEPTVIEEASSTLPVGERQIKQAGREGVLEVTIEEKYVNGELVESNEVSRQVLRQPVSRVILVGTKEQTTQVADTTNSADSSLDNIQSSISNSGMPFSYSKLITGVCTAYNEDNGITAIGTTPAYGTVAVNPAVIPYGTRLYICSADGSYVYGYAVAEDTGDACMNGEIVVDLYMNTLDECLAFGRQTLCIYILD